MIIIIIRYQSEKLNSLLLLLLLPQLQAHPRLLVHLEDLLELLLAHVHFFGVRFDSFGPEAFKVCVRELGGSGVEVPVEFGLVGGLWLLLLPIDSQPLFIQELSG